MNKMKNLRDINCKKEPNKILQLRNTMNEMKKIVTDNINTRTDQA